MSEYSIFLDKPKKIYKWFFLAICLISYGIFFYIIPKNNIGQHTNYFYLGYTILLISTATTLIVAPLVYNFKLKKSLSKGQQYE